MNHPSRLTLDRLSVGDLSGASLDAARTHVTECGTCAGYLAELDTARRARLDAVSTEAFVARVATKRDAARARDRRRVFVGAASAIAAIAAVVLLAPRPHERLGLRGSGFAVHRLRDGVTRVLAAGDTIRAGDALRVVVTQPRAGYVGAWFVDARGQVDAVLPEGPVAFGPGEHALPGSSIVDRPCVDLTLVIVVESAPPANLESDLKKAVAGGIPPGDTWIPPGAVTGRFACE